MKSNKVLLGLCALMLVGCVNNSPSTSSKTSTSSQDPNKVVQLNMSVQYQKSDTRMSFDAATIEALVAAQKKADPVKYANVNGYLGADGKTYVATNLKPVWQEVSDRLKITINDVVPGDSINDSFSKWQTAGFGGVDVLQGGSTNILNEGNSKGTILDLSKYLNEMPNFNKFLNDNPIVKDSITTHSGAIYYAPYFDGNDDVEKMLVLRHEWVKKLLDAADTNSHDTAYTLTNAYTPFNSGAKVVEVTKADGTKDTITKSGTKNIIQIQNALTTKNGQTLTKAFIDYIKESYGNQYEKPSDLFLTSRASYDADELIALFRCVKANPNLLTGDATKNIVPLFPREYQNARVADLWGFMNTFGVRGMTSRNGYLYVDSDNKLHDARNEDKTLIGLEKMNQMYKEGLILKDFTKKEATSNTSGNFRDGLLLKNSGNGNAGFCSFDYNQTSTALNTNSDAPENLDYAAIVPAAADWKGDGKYFQFIESWRSVKTEGWCLASHLTNNPEKLARALRLFDYFYGAEGNELMSYGPAKWIAHNGDQKVTINYQGKQVPKLADQTIWELEKLMANNYTNYYRKVLGGTFPVGYVKEQGMEYQTCTASGKKGLDSINLGVVSGSIKHVLLQDNANDRWYNIVPTTLPFNSSESEAVSKNYTDLDTAINNTNGKANVWTDYVIYGFDNAEGKTLTKANYLKWVNETLSLDRYVALQNAAYKRIIE